ncbi:hypothetical protein [Kosakonia cowanii]|nr:hypothetical protein [Kosakonia cowanii]MDT3409906.1 hypothetical protein [Atlantibacter sp. SORGH_AS_0304]
MAATPYPAYDLARLMSLVGRISEAPSGKADGSELPSGNTTQLSGVARG